MVAGKSLRPIRTSASFDSEESQSPEWTEHVEERETLAKDDAEERWEAHQQRLSEFIRTKHEQADADAAVMYDYTQPFASPSRIADSQDEELEPLAMDSKMRRKNASFSWEDEVSPARMTIKSEEEEVAAPSVVAPRTVVSTSKSSPRRRVASRNHYYSGPDKEENTTITVVLVVAWVMVLGLIAWLMYNKKPVSPITSSPALS